MNSYSTPLLLAVSTLTAACAAPVVPFHDPSTEPPTAEVEHIASVVRQAALSAPLAGCRAEYPEFTVEVFSSRFDLPCEGACIGQLTATEYGPDGRGTAFVVQVAQVAEFGQVPTRRLELGPLAHELVHLLCGSDDHKDARIWGPGGVRWTAYTNLGAFSTVE